MKTMSPDVRSLAGILPEIVDKVVSLVKAVEDNDSKKQKIKKIIC